jgi:hypothetical protein
VSTLYPTPTRLRLLRSASRTDEVYTEAGVVRVASTGAKVTVRVDELLRAGWVCEVPHTVFSGRTAYAVTVTGREVLDKAEGKSP